jgi:HK97 family phage portal protein
MGIFKRLFGVEKTVQKAMSFRVLGGVPVYSDASTETLIKNSFNQNIDFFAVIKRISQKFGHIPRYVISPTRKKSFDDNIIDNELSRLLQYPNQGQGQDTFFELIAIQYILTGEAFIWKNRGGSEGGKPLELYVLPSSCVDIIPDGLIPMGISSFVFDYGTGRIQIPKQDMIHWKTANPTSDQDGSQLRGFNPLIPQRKTIQQGNDITDASVAMYQNGGAKGVLYNETMDSLNEQQQDDLRGIINTKINNKEMKAAVSAFQGKWGYLNLGLSSVDMQLLEADEKIAKKICNANGLPYELFQSDTTFANKKEAWYFFITNTLMPMAASLDAEFNKVLAPDFGKGLLINTDFNELPEMQAMRIEQVKAYAAMWELTPNERRSLSGFEPIKMKEMDMVYLPSGNIPIDEASMGGSVTDEDRSDYESEQAL